MSVATSGVFKGLKTPRDVLNYNLMYGVTDFSNLEQFDYYEKGYPLLVVTKIPTFMEDLAGLDPEGFGTLINNYVHVLEHDFKGLDGLDNIQGEANGEITNGIRSLQIINKVTKPATTTVNMQFVERSGSLMTKGNELYLTGIKDPDTQYKLYHGLIDAYRQKNINSKSGEKPGPDKEVFEFLYIVTDNTGTEVERAFLLASAQANIADFATLYNTEKGQIEFPTIQLSFNVFPINNNMVYVKAQKALMAMRNLKNTTNSRLVVDSNNYRYKSLNELDLGDKGADNEFTLDNTYITEEGRWGSNATKEVGTEGVKTGSVNAFNTKANMYDNMFGDDNDEHMFAHSTTDSSGTSK
jgi:hypothetical protein